MLTVNEYLQQVSLLVPRSGDITAFTCKEDTTLQRVIATLTSNKIERVYVIDSDRKPIGLLTLTDICAQILFFH